jgi:hypothetical protein
MFNDRKGLSIMNQLNISAEPVLQPYQLGALQLPNRVVMSPMTRGRATNPLLIPTEPDVDYFTQRGSAGLIITGGTWVNRGLTGTASDTPTCPDCSPTSRPKRGRRSPPRSMSAAAAFRPTRSPRGCELFGKMCADVRVCE